MHILKIKRIDEGEELNIVAYLNLDWYIFGENLSFRLHSGYFAVTGYGNIFTAVGYTGKAQFNISSRLHWAIGLGLGTVSTP